MAGQRVVITGMGAVSPFGVGRDALWEALRDGRSGIGPIRGFDTSELSVTYGGEVRDFAAARHLNDVSRLVADEKSVQMGLVAAREALAQAGLLAAPGHAASSERAPTAVVVGTGQGPCHFIEQAFRGFVERGARGVRPTTVPKSMYNCLSSWLSLYFGLTGPNHVIAAACASSAAAVGQAYLMVRSGQEQRVLCGGADAPLCSSVFTAWSKLRVLARHDDPARAARPFDRDRNGLVVGEAAAMLVLEPLELAERRGARILAELVGYGASSDAHHLTAPSRRGQVQAMRRCLADAGVEPDEVDYVNAHGTGTVQNDQTEAESIAEVFGPRGASLPVSSTKSMLGHSIGASGAIELLACIAAIKHQFVPPTINCEQPDPDVGLDYVPLAGRPHDLRIAMSNSFAFGGNNSVILVRRPPAVTERP